MTDRDRTAQTEPLTTGQQIVAKWEGLNGWTEPADLAEAIDDAIAAARSAALEEAAKALDQRAEEMTGLDEAMGLEMGAAIVRELKG